jgi:hypothetical protein
MVRISGRLIIAIAIMVILLAAAMANAQAESLHNVSAAEVVSKIESGENIDYQNVSIEGDLDLSGQKEPLNQEVRITNCRIGKADFEGVTFEEPLDMRGTVFQDSVSFAKAKVLSDARFSDAVFLGATDFRNSNFIGSASFTGAQFLNDTSFANARFDGDLSFLDSSFAGDVQFDYAQFSRIVTFWDARFNNVSFLETKFDEQTTFAYAQFSGSTLFASTNFGSDVVFRSSLFNRNAQFGLAQFNGLCDFSGASFKGMAIFLGIKAADNIYFTDTRFDQDLILEGARIYGMQLNNASFGENSKIDLKDADFSRFVVRWDTIKDRMVFDGAAYQALVKNYKNLEWFNDADDCYYQYRRLSQAQEPWGWTKLADVIAWLSCGYGVRVSYVSFWCVFTILIFGLIYWAGNGMRRFEIAGIEVPVEAGGPNNDPNNQRTSLVDAIYFSVAMFTTSQAPVNNFPVKIYRHLAMFEGILGWFFLGLFVVVLSGVLIR